MNQFSDSVRMQNQMTYLVSNGEPLPMDMMECIYSNEFSVILYINHSRQFFVEWQMAHYSAQVSCYSLYWYRDFLNP